MSLLAKGVVSSLVVVAGVCALACSNGPPALMQAGIISNIQPIPGDAQDCNIDGPFITIGDPNDNTMIIPTGTGDDVIVCSVIPPPNVSPACDTSMPNCVPYTSYTVSATAQITGGVSPGQLSINGTFTPRPRDMTSHNPNADTTTKITPISVDFQDATKHLKETDCYGQFVTVDNGEPSSVSLDGNADVYADDHGGRIWISVFCPLAVNIKTDVQGLKQCEGSMTFRFENCTSKSQ